MTSSNYDLRWDAFQNNLCDGFAYLQQKSEFVDMTLAADGHFVQVHQSIVALASPFLKSLLKSLTCPHPVIYLDVSHEVLGFLLEYMYSGELILPQEKCKEFIKYGKKLKMFGLEKLPTYYDEPLVIQRLPDNVPVYPDNKTVTPNNTECAIEVLEDVALPQQSTSTTHNDIIILPSLHSQTLATEPTIVPVTQNVPNIEIIPANQDIATIPKKDIQVSNKLIQLLESVENYEFTDNDIESNMKMSVDTNIPLSEFNLSPNLSESANPDIESNLYATSITNVGTHQDMPIVSNIHIDAQAIENFKVDIPVRHDFENLNFFKSPNDMSRLKTMNIESTSKEAHNMSIDENNETMNSIDTVLEYKLLGDFSIAGAKQQAQADKGIKDDPWDLIPIKNEADRINSDDESNIEKEDQIIDVEEELDKINRKKAKIDVSSLPILDNETLFDESFRKDFDLEMSDEEKGQSIVPMKHSSPIPKTKEQDKKPAEIEVSLFGQVIQKIEVNPAEAKVNPIIQFTLSNRDSLQMIMNRYLYYVHYKSGLKRRRWRCVDYKLKHCLAYVDTDGDTFVKRSNAHNHGFHDARIAKQIAKHKVFSSMEGALKFVQKHSCRFSSRNPVTYKEDDDSS